MLEEIPSVHDIVTYISPNLICIQSEDGFLKAETCFWQVFKLLIDYYLCIDSNY